jgi:Uma2 family endonuclease
MATASPPAVVPELHSGDHMRQKEFHRIYEQTEDKFKAELIGGIVYVASPLKLPHGKQHVCLAAVFGVYQGNTPGVEAGDSATIIMDEANEPQPDLYLRILPEHGGQSLTTHDEYLAGAPELLAEIAHSSRAIDLHGKKEQYAQAGVLEYIVVNLRDKQLRWFDLAHDDEFASDTAGVFRSRVFPGLWIHGASLLARQHRRLMDTLQQGLATPEHAAFVAKLAGQQTRRRKGKPPRRRRHK